MHLFKFSTAQKLAYLGLAQRLIKADGKISNYESAFLDTKRKEMGFDDGFTVEEAPIDLLLKPFNTRQIKVWLVIELFMLGHFDEELAAQELSFITDVAKKLGFKKGEIASMKAMGEQIEKLIKDHRALY